MERIEAILFDFGGTLDNDGTDWFTRIYHLVSSYVDDLDRDGFAQFADVAAKEIAAMEDTGKLTMDQTAHRFCLQIHKKLNNGFGCNVSKKASQWDPAAVAEQFVVEARGYLQRNRELMGRLHGRYRLGCISNNWGNTAGWCRQFELHDYFDTMVDSAVVGSSKPEKKIFQVALDELQLGAEQCVYVGDNYVWDVLGSHNAGMKPVWITGGQDNIFCGDADSGSLEVDPLQIEKLTDLLDMKW
jgi:putative hydrolase of the HAD superfamily